MTLSPRDAAPLVTLALAALFAACSGDDAAARPGSGSGTDGGADVGATSDGSVGDDAGRDAGSADSGGTDSGGSDARSEGGPSDGGMSYSTSFPLTENPISEGGRWVNGGLLGLDWTNVSTTPGLAIGHQVAASYTD